LDAEIKKEECEERHLETGTATASMALLSADRHLLTIIKALDCIATELEKPGSFTIKKGKMRVEDLIGAGSNIKATHTVQGLRAQLKVPATREELAQLIRKWLATPNKTFRHELRHSGAC